MHRPISVGRTKFPQDGRNISFLLVLLRTRVARRFLRTVHVSSAYRPPKKTALSCKTPPVQASPALFASFFTQWQQLSMPARQT